MPLTNLNTDELITPTDVINRIKDSNIVTSSVLNSASWLSATYGNETVYYYKYSNPNITQNSIIEISSSPSATYDQRKAFVQCKLHFKSQGNGYIEMWNFGIKPTINVPINIVIRKDTTAL